MCGIVGSLAFDSSSSRLTLATIIRMRDSMAHRGPDGCGSWMSEDGRIGFGHRRLSIIDLSDAASQPMQNADGSLTLIFNGEIYNHAEIRAELEKRANYHWKTDHSDTEVILHAFAQWGIECVEKFRGMFAFAIWDARKRELWLVRDRIGVKPLYYSVHHGRITFASEIKALLCDPEQDRAVDEESLYHFLSFLTTPAPKTLFRGIHKLPGGTWLRARPDGNIQEHRYWDVLNHTRPLTGKSDHEVAGSIREELRTAVRVRKVGDVPVGVFLSGGIDSSVNAVLFAENTTTPVETFSIGYDGNYRSYPSELPYARRIAEQVGAHHHERILSQQDLIDFLPEMIRLQDEPIADPVCVPVYYVSKLARDSGVRVCQVGEGSDELFCGYPLWRLKLQLQKYGNIAPGLLKQLVLGGLKASGAGDTHSYEWLRRSSAGLPVFWGGAESFTEAGKHRLLSPRLRNELKGLSSWDALSPIFQRFNENAWECSTLSWMTYLDLNFRLPELLLMRVDKMSMGASLEARVPFLDHKFVELAMSIPAEVKTRNGNLKYILKKAVRGLIPDDLIDRKKQGFGVPVREWFSDRLGDFARDELRRFCRDTDFLDAKEVDLLVRKDGKRAWYLLNFALWWRHSVGT
jgi:asparagine synthase (glutamine-hydrolysing)